MAKKTITVTFVRQAVAEAVIEVPDGFDPVSDTYEDVVRDWLGNPANAGSLEFQHEGCPVEVWSIDEDPSPEAPASPVAASVTLQRWVRDYAVDVDEVGFDCRSALDAIPLADLPEYADGFSDGACDFGDDVYRNAVAFHAVQDWDGPFCFDISDCDAYEAYYDARAKAAGLPPVER